MSAWRALAAAARACAARQGLQLQLLHCPAALGWQAATASAQAQPASALLLQQRLHALHVQLYGSAAPEHRRAAVQPHTDVEEAIAAVAAATGRTPSPADAALAARLKQSWYSTAGDVARMSKEELQLLNVPTKLWAALQHLTTQPVAAAAAGQPRPQQQQQQQAPPAQPDICDDDLPADIMQRRMPSSTRVPDVLRVAVRHVPLKTSQRYGLQKEELRPQLQAELEALQRFCCGAYYDRRVPPLRPVTFKMYQRQLSYLLGFAHRVRGVPLDQLSLRTLLPSHGREGVSLLLDFQHWRQQERGTAARTQINPIKAVVWLARFLYHEQSQPGASPPYRDLEVVQELATMLTTASKAALRAPLVSDEARKWLQWDEFLGMVQALRAECAGLTASGQPRPRREVAASLQRYLIVAILSVVPDRQRTLRELEVGRTLLRRDGGWVIKHGPGDYKTGKQYGDRPPLVIAPFIYPELEAFIDTWRHELRPQSAALFVRPRTGRPFDEAGLTQLFVAAARRLTGKALNPHLVRDMIVTHLRNQGVSETEMEALALLMGHSVREARRTYDRRSKVQKVTPAVELMLQLAADM